MAVYTELNKDEIEKIISLYSIGELVEYKGIAKGIMNTNYLIITTKDKYILRILEGDRELTDEIRELEYLEYISSKGIPCPTVLHSKKCESYLMRDDKMMSIFSFLEGSEVKNINEEILFKFGRILGEMHNCSKEMQLNRKEKIELEYLYEGISKDRDKLKEILGNDFEEIDAKYREIKEYDFSKLPSGIIHNDIFPDNVFVKDDYVSGVIDFNDALSGPFLYDIAIVLNFWIYGDRGCYDSLLVESFIKGYEEIRHLGSCEKEALPMALDKMALTFISLRLKKFQFFEGESDNREFKDYRNLLPLLREDKEGVV